MKSKKLIAMLLAGAMSATLLAGCGGGNKTPANGSAGSGNGGGNPTAPSGSTVTLKYDLTVSLDHPWGLAATEFKTAGGKVRWTLQGRDLPLQHLWL